MKDYRDIMPNVPVVEGWTTTNYRDREHNGEVAKMQGFVGVDYDGRRVPPRRRGFNAQGDPTDETVEYVGVPEGKFHSDLDYWPVSRDDAVRHALEHVQRLMAQAQRILASIDRAMEDDSQTSDTPA